jgi:hypothetical protein
MGANFPGTSELHVLISWKWFTDDRLSGISRGTQQSVFTRSNRRLPFSVQHCHNTDMEFREHCTETADELKILLVPKSLNNERQLPTHTQLEVIQIEILDAGRPKKITLCGCGEGAGLAVCAVCKRH